jgi:hypothetical protein
LSLILVYSQLQIAFVGSASPCFLHVPNLMEATGWQLALERRQCSFPKRKNGCARVVGEVEDGSVTPIDGAIL